MNSKDKKRVVIIDYNSGNLHSVENALKKIIGGWADSHDSGADNNSNNDSDNNSDVGGSDNINIDIIISSNPRDLDSATHIILPGVGAFGDCADNLNAIEGMTVEIKRQILEERKPFLGICVGMQLLADYGFEHGEHKGLGLIGGDVKYIKTDDPRLKIPHMGWNELHLAKDESSWGGVNGGFYNERILQEISTGDHAYFVHSYHFICRDESDILAYTQYGDIKIAAILAKDNMVATQFHPEKSGKTGLTLLKNFLLI